MMDEVARNWDDARRGAHHLLVQAGFVALIVAGGMTVYELMIDRVMPDRTHWESHFATVVFTTMVAVIAAVLVLRRDRRQQAMLAQMLGRERQAEATLQAAHDELESRVAGRTAELGRANVLLQREIQQRKRAESKMRDALSRFEAIFELTPAVSIQGFDRDGVIQHWNAASQRLYGYSAEEAIGKRLGDLILSGDAADQWQRTLAEVWNSGQAQPSGEWSVKDRQGNTRWVYSSIFPVMGGEKVVEVFCMDVDMTERKRAEQALRNSEAMLQSVFRAAPMGIGLVSDRILGWSNEQVSVLTGYTQQELEGCSARVLYENQEEFERVGRVKYAEIAEGRTGTVETRWKRKDGTLVDVLLSSAPIDPDDISAGVVFTATDITKRKKAEQHAQERLAELAHVSRLSTMGELASALGHELNQPLAAIVNYANGCVRRLRGAGGEGGEVMTGVQNIASQAARAGEIIRHIRDFVRRAEPQQSAADLNEVVREVESIAQIEARQGGVQLRFQLAGHLPEVMVDSIQIQQVILNLVRNGIEAMSGAAADRRVLTIRTARIKDSRIEVSVSDLGLGLPADGGERLFEQFFTTKPEGMGMGLPISRSIVEAHGGNLWAAPNPEGGAIFTFTLPVGADDNGGISE
ncbi:MAG TPA: PAS domain S-box protein [Phycisphaerae bacterium]|nr:PAS domain S-box protein [Phycisphaerae bacterium]